MEDYRRGYAKGLDDAWLAAQEFVTDFIDSPMEQKEIVEKYRLEDIRAGQSISFFFFRKGPHYAMESIEKDREKPKVGDEITVSHRTVTGKLKKDYRGVILRISDRVLNDEKEIILIMSSGRALAFDANRAVITKTGRRFPEVPEMLKKMKAGEDNAE